MLFNRSEIHTYLSEMLHYSETTGVMFYHRNVHKVLPEPAPNEAIAILFNLDVVDVIKSPRNPKDILGFEGKHLSK